MARAGRKRRPGVARNANGEILTSAKNAERRDRGDGDWRAREVAHFQRAKMIVNALIKDPKLGTTIGKMLLLAMPRAISAQMYAAGEHACRILSTYDRIVLGVNRNPSGIVIGDTGGRSTSSEPDQETVERATKNLMRLERTLGRAVMSGVAHAVKVLVRGGDITDEQADLAIMGLKELVKEYGFDEISEQDGIKAAKKYRFIGEEKLLEAIVLTKQ
jgi:hypothetical protein